MQLFAITFGLDAAGQQALKDALGAAAAEFPQLAGTFLETGSSRSGRLHWASVAHGAEAAVPRRYLFRGRDSVALFDGLPLDREGHAATHDAAVLAKSWNHHRHALTGIYAVARIDLSGDELELVSDALGLCQVLCWEAHGAWVVSNSAAVIQRLTPARGVDPLAVGSLLSLGWPVADRTLTSGVHVVPGGHLHRFSPQGHSSEEQLTPALVVPRLLHDRSSPAEVADRLTHAVRAAANVSVPLRCGVTAGRDSRVVLGLADAAKAELDCYTVGRAGDVDVDLGASLCRLLGVPHQVWAPELPPDDEAWLAQTLRFSSQTGGLANIASIADWLDNQREPDPLAVKLWGIGGEIGRAAIGLGTAVAANVPGVRSSMAAQRRVLSRKLLGASELLSGACADATDQALGEFLERRRDEGWRTSEVLEAYYTFERMRHWAAAGVRRASATTDLFSPFVTPDFVKFAFSMGSGERYVEEPHRVLLEQLSPELRAAPFSKPWRPRRPRLAPALVLREAFHAARRGPAPPSAAITVGGRSFAQFGHAWCEAGTTVLRERVIDFESSPLWEYVDRQALVRVLSATPEERAGSLETICRTVTAFIHLHGRELVPDPTPARARAK